LEANTRAMVKTGGATDAAVAAVALTPGEAARALVWREGMIAFEASTLREAAKEFARYSDKRIVIDDVNVANETVTGLYSAYDPVGFAKAVASSFGLHVEIRADEVRLSP
jgi:transmembrane sensor